MIRNIKNNFKFVRNIFRLKRSLNPDPIFLRSARGKFLNSLAPQRISLRHHILQWSHVMAVIIIALGGTGSLAAFADIKDVPVTSSLYEFKRVSEATRIVLIPEEKKPDAHAKLAARRLKEIKQAQPVLAVAPTTKTISALQTPASASAETATPLPILKKLDEELRHEISKAIEQRAEERKDINENKKTEREKVKSDRRIRVCKLAAEAAEKNLIELRRGGALEKSCELDF